MLRLASAFDIGLDVFFTPFSDLIDRKESFEPDTFKVASFTDEIAATEQAQAHQVSTETTIKYSVIGLGAVGKFDLASLNDTAVFLYDSESMAATTQVVGAGIQMPSVSVSAKALPQKADKPLKLVVSDADVQAA